MLRGEQSCPMGSRADPGMRVGFIPLCAALRSEREKANARRPLVVLPSTAPHCRCHPSGRDLAWGSSSPPPLQMSEQELLY